MPNLRTYHELKRELAATPRPLDTIQSELWGIESEAAALAWTERVKVEECPRGYRVLGRRVIPYYWPGSDVPRVWYARVRFEKENGNG